MSFPTSKTNAADNTTEIVAAHLNNLEDKVGINSSVDSNSLDYQVNNTTGGHDHDGTDSKSLNNAYAFVAGMGVLWWGAITDIPSKWIFCNGAAIDRTTYADLFTNISTIHGTGDGSTTFNIPDARDQVVYGAKEDDSGVPKTNVTGALLQSGGAATHLHTTGDFTLLATHIPTHLHTVNPPNTTSANESRSHTHQVKGNNDGGTGGTRIDAQTSGNTDNTGNANQTHYHNVNIAEFNSGNYGGGNLHNHGNSETVSTVNPFIAAAMMIYSGV
ncbi:MAG TPA: tail fiber protein [Candidatus Moranbacteria bacterium]|nr:tail fiber protein [Candidatus Moranbacteria bacterium]